MKKIMIVLAVSFAMPFLMLQSCGSSNPPEEQIVYIEPKVEKAPLFPVRENGLYGFIDKKGNMVVEPQFIDVIRGGFSEGLVFVKKDDESGAKWGALNSTGEMVIEPQFCEVRRFSEGLAAVQMHEDSLWGYIDMKGGWAIEPRFERAIPFSEELAVVKANEKWGAIDKNGTFVIEPQFDGMGMFSEGLASVRINDKYGFIDDKGKMVIVPQFDEAWWNFSGGMCAVYVDDKCGLIDKNGKWIFEPNYFEDIIPISEGIWQASMDNGSYAYVDSAGMVFDFVFEYYDGLCSWSTTDGKYGYVNKNDEFDIAPQYDVAYEFNNGLALVGIGEGLDSFDTKPWEKGMWGYIDTKGNMVYYSVCE